MERMTIKEFKEESNFEVIESIMKMNNGYVTSKELDNFGIHRMYLNSMWKKGIVEKVAPGIYIDINKIEDNYYVFSLSMPNTIYSHMTALYFHGLSIKAPNDTFKVLSLDYLNCLEYFKNRNIKIDLLFLDPPYKDQIYEQIINKMEEDGTLSEDALIVIEASLESPLPAFDKYLRKDYKYKDKTLVILEKYQ